MTHTTPPTAQPAIWPAEGTLPAIDLRCCDGRRLLDRPHNAPLVALDPPWSYENWSDKAHGAAAAHYDSLSMWSIARQVAMTYDVAAKDAYLVLWCTYPKHDSWVLTFYVANRLRKKRGLGTWRSVTGGAWGKTNGLGVGFHVRGDAEPWKVYVKGSPRPREHLSNLCLSPRIGHSEKAQGPLRDIVRNYSDRGDLVLDLYAGASASLARACRATGRRYLGAEIDRARWERAMHRLALEEQADMFEGAAA